ncbi:MAG: phosphatase PAP2 family protein [Bacteroidota bacterium]|nr:phosphatase PAP2 family protein [Bacteroidota bacterium]
MKLVKTFLLTTLFYLLISVSNMACKKEIQPEAPALEDATAARMNDNSGFAENDMVLYWNQKASIVLSTLPNTPPAQARYFAMIQIAVHDALNSIKPKFQRFALQNQRQKSASPDAAVASAAYWAIKKMNLQGTNPIDQWYNESLNTISDGESKETGKTLGEESADAIIANRLTDNFLQANIQIPLPDGIAPGAYRSTLPFSLPTMPKIKALHQWGTLMKPFVTQSNNQFRPAAPDPINSAAYETEYNEIKTKGARVEGTRSAEETEIGVFWVERSSIGWNRFARNIISAKRIDAWKTARLFALIHTAMVDGVSGCFEAKYYYSYWRPETAIRLGNVDGNNNTTGDANWLPMYIESPNINNPALNVNTPPIPDYPSAHANFGGAAAEILALFFGTDFISVSQTSSILPGITRHYTSIAKAARDNALSRIFVGYHFRKGCIFGEQQGKQIANYVFNNSFGEIE